MFKNNKIKNLLAVSLLMGGSFLNGVTASAVKAPPNFKSGTSSHHPGVRKPVFSYSKLLKGIRSGDPEALGNNLVINKSKLVLDLDEIIGPNNLSAQELDIIKAVYMNSSN